jgi:CheY-like chemotaxis protein
MTEYELLEGKRVLLVDDEPDVLDTLEDLLPMCETLKATNYNDARDCLETLYFDLTILDIMGVQGYELLEIANQRDVTAVMLTAGILPAQGRNGEHRILLKRCSGSQIKRQKPLDSLV